MANRERGELRLVAGPLTYVLRLTTNSCCELEEFSGRLWMSILKGGQIGSVRDVRLIMWAGLRDHHPDIATADPAGLTAIGNVIDQCGGMLEAGARVKALLALNAESGETKTEGKADPEARPLEAQVGTGVSSTSTH